MIDNYGCEAEPQDELAELRTRVARLEQALAHERREREALQAMLVPNAAQLRQQLDGLRRETEKDYTMLTAAIDDRLRELAQNDQLTPDVIVTDVITPMLRLMEGQMTINQAQARNAELMHARIAALEALLRPALDGKAKLMAQQV